MIDGPHVVQSFRNLLLDRGRAEQRARYDPAFNRIGCWLAASDIAELFQQAGPLYTAGQLTEGPCGELKYEAAP